MEGSSYRKFSISRRKGAILGPGPENSIAGNRGSFQRGSRGRCSAWGLEDSIPEYFSPTTPMRPRLHRGPGVVTSTILDKDCRDGHGSRKRTSQSLDIKASVPWPSSKIKNIRKLRLNLIQVESQLGQGVSSSQLNGLFGFRADGPSPGQWRAVRSGHWVMDCWGLGQGCGLSPEGLGKALGLGPASNPNRIGDGMQVA
ncbi:hypothetical protein DY000_02014392 [Brassica cretica]|uniref:Uncharacterized protein n=1 Tax=Brassica cretica TaxID=69181 RepID=A0ABQ7D8T5_BRACR|nr:hypothetical protein DY000_02014392 [Brassica cretica]